MHSSQISDVSLLSCVAELEGSGVLWEQPVDEDVSFAGCLAAETCC